MQTHRIDRHSKSIALVVVRIFGLACSAAASVGCNSSSPPNAPAADRGLETATIRAASSRVALQPHEPYPPTPAGFASAISTGVAVADLNGDGFPDIVVSNGDDLAQGPIWVFLSDHGTFQHSPSWTSNDTDYYTGVALGDLDDDQKIDIAVSVGPDPCSGHRGGVKVYRGHGDGTFDPNGKLVSNEGYLSVGCAIGDADGDGHLDLAAAVAEEYSLAPGPTRVYESPSGSVSATHVWRSQSVTATGAKFADLDGDGLLDLLLAAPGLPVYRGSMGDAGSATLSSVPETLVQDSTDYPMSVDIERTDAGSMVAASYSDFGSGSTEDCGDAGTNTKGALTAKRVRHSIFRARNIPEARAPKGMGDAASPACTPAAGISSTHFVAYEYPMKKEPAWTSEDTGWGAGIALAQAGGHPGLDLIATRVGPSISGVGAPLQIYPHDGASFAKLPGFSSSTCTFEQSVALTDLRQRSLVETKETFGIDRPRVVLTLSVQVVNKIEGITRNAEPVGPKDYAAIPGGNWISFAKHLQPGDTVIVTYNYSTNLDIVVTNGDVDNSIYYNNNGL